MRAIKITKTRLKEMKDSIILSEFIRHTCPDLETFGRNKFCICPFHKEKTGSLCVNDELDHFYCFGCGEQGDHISFIYARLFKNLRVRDDMNKYAGEGVKLKVFMKCVRILSQITGIPIK